MLIVVIQHRPTFSIVTSNIRNYKNDIKIRSILIIVIQRSPTLFIDVHCFPSIHRI